MCLYFHNQQVTQGETLWHHENILLPPTTPLIIISASINDSYLNQLFHRDCKVLIYPTFSFYIWLNSVKFCTLKIVKYQYFQRFQIKTFFEGKFSLSSNRKKKQFILKTWGKCLLLFLCITIVKVKVTTKWVKTAATRFFLSPLSLSFIFSFFLFNAPSLAVGISSSWLLNRLL